MDGLSDYYEDKLNDFLFGAQALTPEATYYLALATATVGEDDDGSTFTEANYTGYARVALTNNKTNFSASSGGVVSNATEIRFPKATGGSSTVVELVLLDAETDGNIICGGTITTSKTYSDGDRPVFEIGEITFTID